MDDGVGGDDLDDLAALPNGVLDEHTDIIRGQNHARILPLSLPGRSACASNNSLRLRRDGIFLREWLVSPGQISLGAPSTRRTRRTAWAQTAPVLASARFVGNCSASGSL